MNSLGISYGTLTDQGERAINEDYLGVMVSIDRLAFILCDGLGGHGNGDVASQLVVNEMKHTLEAGLTMQDSIQDAQDKLIRKQEAEGLQDSMKTTVTCLILSGKTALIGHVGDSRIYLFEKGKCKFRTMDHSVPQMLANRGDIKEKDIRFHEDRSRLLRVMGSEWDRPKYTIMDPLILHKDQTFLLCSDGFWELIDEKMMSKLLKKSSTPEEWLSRMQEVIVDQGKGKNMDNYSAIAVFIR